MKKIYAWEPWFFMFFGLFHLHRIWGFFIASGAFVFYLGVKLLKQSIMEIEKGLVELRLQLDVANGKDKYF